MAVAGDVFVRRVGLWDRHRSDGAFFSIAFLEKLVLLYTCEL